MSEKCCLGCVHMRWYSGMPPLSEVTPGENTAIYCNIGRWEIDMWDDELSDARKKLFSAATCPAFDVVKSLSGKE